MSNQIQKSSRPLKQFMTKSYFVMLGEILSAL